VGVRDGLPDIDWVEVKAGDFIYGDEKPKKIAMHALRMARYPVTHAQYACFIQDGGYEDDAWWHGLERQQPGQPSWSDPHHPRETVSWYEATAFCRWLDARLRVRKLLEKTEQLRLPTEQEWEKAARGTDGREYPWGEYADGHANFDETTHGGPHYLQQTSVVGLYRNGASPFGLQDMAGNVWEWCADKYEPKDKSKDAPRVLRGGSWDLFRDLCRCASRGWHVPGARNGNLGFRVCIAPPIS
jgi:formylglycine-generating enzyme required for sulfatase activity